MVNSPLMLVKENIENTEKLKEKEEKKNQGH